MFAFTEKTNKRLINLQWKPRAIANKKRENLTYFDVQEFFSIGNTYLRIDLSSAMASGVDFLRENNSRLFFLKLLLIDRSR